MDMALNVRVLCRSVLYFHNVSKSAKCGHKIYPIRFLASGICYNGDRIHRPLIEVKQVGFLPGAIRQCSTQRSDSSHSIPEGPEQKKPGLIQRFKEMYRDYWYVLGPVHMATSAIWFCGFYYAVRSGLDVVSILETFNVNEKILNKLRDSSAGYFALALVLYKLVTPLRYAVTIGGTTFAIKKLLAMGWIKPVPSRKRIKEMIQEKRDNIQDQMKQRHIQVMEEMRKYKTEMRDMKNKVKKM